MNSLRNLKLINNSGELQNIALITGAIAIISFYVYLLAYSFFLGYYLEGQNDFLTYSILNPIPFNYRALLFFGAVLVFSIAGFGLIIRRWCDLEIVSTSKLDILKNIIALLFLSSYFSVVLINFNSGIWIDVKTIMITLEIMSVTFIFIMLFRRDIVVVVSSLAISFLFFIAILMGEDILGINISSIINNYSSGIFIIAICLSYIFPRIKIYSVTSMIIFFGYLCLASYVLRRIHFVLDEWYFQVLFFVIYTILDVFLIWAVKRAIRWIMWRLGTGSYYNDIINQITLFFNNIRLFIIDIIKKQRVSFMIVVLLSLLLSTIQIMYYLGKESNDVLPDSTYSCITLNDGTDLDGIMIGNDGNFFYISTSDGKLVMISSDKVDSIE